MSCGDRVADGVSWLVRRRIPLVATVALIIIGMVTTTWGADLLGRTSWALPHDLWRTTVAAERIRQLDFAGIYTPPTALVSFPGAAVILVPIAFLVDMAGLGLDFQNAHNPYPEAWLLIGPYTIAISAIVLFAVDSTAERFGASVLTRVLSAVAGSVGVWSVAVRWGHPEDAVAVALLLCGVMALPDGKPVKAAWLIGAAIAVQPLTLLGLPVVLAVLPGKQLAAFVIRTVLPAVFLLGVAAVANWSATWHAVTSQPNFPSRNHETPWTFLAPDVGNGAVAAGPGRLLAIGLACLCGVIVARRWRGRGAPSSWNMRTVAELLWWIALSLAVRSAFESVMVAYYIWPALALALPAAAISLLPLIKTSICVVVLTFIAEASWPGPFLWWGTVVSGLGITLLVARGQQPGLLVGTWSTIREPDHQY